MIPRSESVVDTANRLVPFRVVLGMTNIYVPEFAYGKSFKTRCPYADIYHLTASASKSMRVYLDTNTGFCYRGCGILTPVAVYAKLNEISYTESARFLLESVGHKLKTFDEKWEEAVSGEEDVNLEGYRQALDEICLSYCKGRWGSLKYESSVSSSFSYLLSILSKAKSYEDADKWLTAAKAFMIKQIDREAGIEFSKA